jgi:hypothetical protein
VAGSYVRQTSPDIDQLKLGLDGTVYSYSSGDFDLILLGTTMPGIGSWAWLNDGSVLITCSVASVARNWGYTYNEV